MANKTIQVQYKLRGDTLDKLTEKNAVYGVNEPVIVVIPAGANSGLNEPAVLLKIGDGVTAFQDLAFVSAVAGDVPAWAKAATKPTYTADEIENLSSYISGKVQDTDTQYKLEQDSSDPHILKLFSKTLGGDWTEAWSVTTADTKYTAGSTAVTVDGDNCTIDINLSSDADNALKRAADGLKVVVPESAVIDVVKKEAANSGYFSSYQVTVDGNPVGVDINIPKDFLVRDVDLLTVVTADDPYTGAKVGDKYIDFVVNTAENDEHGKHMYLPVSELVDEYFAGDGIGISDGNAIYIRLGTNANGLNLRSGALELDLATDAAAGAMSVEDHKKLSGIAAGATKVEASEINGNVKMGGIETKVYELPDTVLDEHDTLILDGGNA